MSSNFFSIAYGVEQAFIIKAANVNYSTKTFLVRIFKEKDSTPLPEMLELTTEITATYAAPDTFIKIPLTAEQASQWEIDQTLAMTIVVFNTDKTIAARGRSSVKVQL